MKRWQPQTIYAEHKDALSKLDEYIDTQISPIDTLATIAKKFVSESGVVLIAHPVLKQTLQGFEGGESLGAGCSFDLLHTKGLARLSIQLQIKHDYLVLETIDTETKKPSRRHMKVDLKLREPKKSKQVLQKIEAGFKKYDTETLISRFLNKFK
ncbi:hypothetical protein SAMN04515647_4078 [Cohaesibacter sp. ES.047]|uniref:hypothetical protein n=1 Tax=Cohaesibacter sp. ES.047 TaxID=1798205 RepID=UPI000BB77FF3|nr:hypothetical protein [Cohaesibacter sp. ES.047]SNY93758.1 hypothetical protein SAMN04515647_4078 [Cohaesibacter sp. ES.047]